MEVFVARHPIFNKLKQVHGYGLEFRAGFDQFYDTVETEKAKVDFQAMLNFDELVGHSRGFLTFSRDMLLKGWPVLLSNESLIVRLSDEIKPDDQVLDVCRQLRQADYTLMIDAAAAANGQGPLLDLADIVRVDFSKSQPDECGTACRRFCGKGISTLATGVGSAGQFEQAAAWGYSYYQGDFFTQPAIQPGRKIAANKLTYMQMLDKVNRSELDYDELEALIRRDVTMTYSLLRFVNSAWYALRREVNSIRHALVLLGPVEVRVWASLLVLRDLGRDKPRELLRRCLTRARMAEQLASLTTMASSSCELFLMGMFSLIDALTDMPMSGVLEDLPLSDDVKKALLYGTGRFAAVYDLILAYERGDWELFSSHAAALGMDEQQVPDIFRKSLKWTGEALAVV